MANPKRRRARSVSHRRNRRRRSSNPMLARRRHHASHVRSYRRRRSHNPVIKSVLKTAAWGSLGAVATRAGTQLVLGGSNQGWLGYAANLAAAYILGLAGDKFAGQEVGAAIAAGGGIATILRIASEQFFSSSSLNQYLTLSGLGDSQFSVSGVGEYVNDPYAVPSVSQGPNQLTTPLLPPLVAPPAPPSRGMHGLGVDRWTPGFNR